MVLRQDHSRGGGGELRLEGGSGHGLKYLGNMTSPVRDDDVITITRDVMR